MNQTLAAIFEQMAAIMEILGVDRFRINSYSRVARMLGDLNDDIAEIGPDVKELQKLPGIGKGTAARIAEFLETGEMEDWTDLREQIPDGLLDLLNIPGLGPKKISLMWNEAGVESLSDLKEKLEGDEISSLPGMGKKTVENLKKSIAFAEASGGRVRIGVALETALWFIDQFADMKEVKKLEYAGSLRRGKETIGDVDLLVAADTKHAEKITDRFKSLEPVTDVLVSGQTKTSVRTTDNIQVDMRIIDPKNFGAALMYFTGSKEHNIRMRERAIKQGASLNEYALTNSETKDVIASETEEDVYKALGLKWIAPEMREDRGEIDLAEKDELPKLIEPEDIAAELHAHTTASDGKWSIEELATACAERGFHTVAVTDHSKGQAQANGLDEKRLEKHIKEIRKVAERMKGDINILAGSEVDILATGKLDYADSLLEQLDIVVASPHAALGQDPDKATTRLVKAIENPFVTIIGHPTGRLINRREGLSPDMKKIIAAAKDRGIALEINANDWRLDLRDTHARAAIESGVKLAINTDAHGPTHLPLIVYGVLTARRAGATKNDVVNCMTKAALTKWLKSTRD